MDVSEVYSPLVSWNVGRDYFKPRFDWTKRVMLFFHKSVELNEGHSYLPVRLLKVVQYIPSIKIVLFDYEN